MALVKKLDVPVILFIVQTLLTGFSFTYKLLETFSSFPEPKPFNKNTFTLHKV